MGNEYPTDSSNPLQQDFARITHAWAVEINPIYLEHTAAGVSIWNGTIDPEDGFNGDYRWTGGTGKYVGITGDNTFRAMPIGETVQGRGLMNGEWKLP